MTGLLYYNLRYDYHSASANDMSIIGFDRVSVGSLRFPVQGKTNQIKSTSMNCKP